MSYVRVIYDFQTVQDGEIPLCVGDIVLYLSDVDENWACGRYIGQVKICCSSPVDSYTFCDRQS